MSGFEGQGPSNGSGSTFNISAEEVIKRGRGIPEFFVGVILRRRKETPSRCGNQIRPETLRQPLASQFDRPPPPPPLLNPLRAAAVPRRLNRLQQIRQRSAK